MSLRAAINQANANPGADEIAFAVAGTILLATAPPAIAGTGVANTIVTSGGYGLLAVGPCSRTRVIRNLIAGASNSLGDVNIASVTGITSLP